MANSKMKNTSVEKPFVLDSSCIVFDSAARKTFIKGILQDIKGYYESKTDGLVEISYEELELNGHEFMFTLSVVRGPKCKKQMYYEASSAVVGAVNYLLQGGSEQYDVSICTEDSRVDIEIVSNW